MMNYNRSNSFLSYFTKDDDTSFTGIVINLKSAEIYQKTSTGGVPSIYFNFSIKGIVKYYFNLFFFFF